MNNVQNGIQSAGTVKEYISLCNSFVFECVWVNLCLHKSLSEHISSRFPADSVKLTTSWTVAAPLERRRSVSLPFTILPSLDFGALVLIPIMSDHMNRIITINQIKKALCEVYNLCTRLWHGVFIQYRWSQLELAKMALFPVSVHCTVLCTILSQKGKPFKYF